MDRLSFLRIAAKEYGFILKAARKVHLDSPEDAVQDVLTTVLANESYCELDPAKGSIRGFLYQCVRNRALSLKRRESFESHLFVSLDSDTTIRTGQEVEDSVSYEPDPVMLTDVAAALSQLTPLERAVAENIYMGKESYYSLAELLGKLESEVQEAGRRCREKLRVALADYGPEQVGKLLAKAG